jgi:hypothetical protein
MNKKIKDLGLDGDQRVTLVQFAAIRIESAILESIQQDSTSVAAPAVTIAWRFLRKNRASPKRKLRRSERTYEHDLAWSRPRTTLIIPRCDDEPTNIK